MPLSCVIFETITQLGLIVSGRSVVVVFATRLKNEGCRRESGMDLKVGPKEGNLHGTKNKDLDALTGG